VMSKPTRRQSSAASATAGTTTLDSCHRAKVAGLVRVGLWGNPDQPSRPSQERCMLPLLVHFGRLAREWADARNR
jgi:hypothetical protein